MCVLEVDRDCSSISRWASGLGGLFVLVLFRDTKTQRRACVPDIWPAPTDLTGRGWAWAIGLRSIPMVQGLNLDRTKVSWNSHYAQSPVNNVIFYYFHFFFTEQIKTGWITVQSRHRPFFDVSIMCEVPLFPG